MMMEPSGEAPGATMYEVQAAAGRDASASASSSRVGATPKAAHRFDCPMLQPGVW